MKEKPNKTNERILDLLDAEYRKEIERKLTELNELERDYESFKAKAAQDFAVNGKRRYFKPHIIE